MNLRDSLENSLLLLTCGRADSNTTKLLLSFGADTELRNQDGATALLLAAKIGCSDCVRLLMEYHANLDAQVDTITTNMLVFLCVG